MPHPLRRRDVETGFRLITLLAALRMFAGAAVETCDTSRFEVGVHLLVDRSIATAVDTRILEVETADLWRPYGVDLRWDETSAVRARAAQSDLEVIVAPRLPGITSPGGAAVLGQATVTLEGLSRRPIFLSFSATQRVLALQTNRRAAILQSEQDVELARALGRVLAHEIGHVLLAFPTHDTVGLMRPVFQPNELAESDRVPFRLTCGAVGRLRSRIRVMTDRQRSANHLELTDLAAIVEDVEGGDDDGADVAPCVTARPVR
jgi:hypothetical protein